MAVEPAVALAVLVVPMAILTSVLRLEGVAGPSGPRFLATFPAAAAVAVAISAPLVQPAVRRSAHIALLVAQAVSEAAVQAKYNEY